MEGYENKEKMRRRSQRSPLMGITPESPAKLEVIAPPSAMLEAFKRCKDKENNFQNQKISLSLQRKNHKFSGYVKVFESKGRPYFQEGIRRAQESCEESP